VLRRVAALWLAAFAAAGLVARAACAQQATLANTRGLDFGRFVAGAGGTVSVDPSGLRSHTGGVILLNGGSPGPAQFTLGSNANGGANGKGGANKAVVISLPPDGSVRLASGAAGMAVNAFVSAPDALLAIPAGGTQLSIGATLSVAAGQPPGKYSGSFSVIVNYQ
jgi:hypothetical protein